MSGVAPNVTTQNATGGLPRRLLIANRGEIAIRIAHAAAELGIETIAVFAEDDAGALHLRKADRAVAIGVAGVRAYLDAARLVSLAQEADCDAVHPGYGFLSENAGFARACIDAGLTFVGPSPESLDLFGDKAAARGLAAEAGVPLLPGTGGATSLEEAATFLESLGPGGAVMVKALAGGGGRGMRAVTDPAALADAFDRCRAEAEGAFGRGDLYVERLIRSARHIEVQVVGDGSGAVAHLWERECTIQRRNQKVVEIAPAPGLDPALRQRLIDAACRLAGHASYRNLGTFEFLVDRDAEGVDGAFAFIEANPRLQVEHTVTEQVTGLDLVKLQLRIAGGASLADLGLDREPEPPRGHAIQLRINAESMDGKGEVKPAGGTLSAFEIPFGPGVRVDTCGHAGFRASPNYDSLLAKLIGHAPGDYADAVARTYRALCEFRIEGVATNIPVLQNLLRHPDFVANDVDTGFLQAHAAELAAAGDGHPVRYAAAAGGAAAEGAVAQAAPEGTVALAAPLLGTVSGLLVAEGDEVRAGQPVVVLEAMKMEHVVAADTAGRIHSLAAAIGDTVAEGGALAFVLPGDVAADGAAAEEDVDPDHIRPDLAEALARIAKTRDAARPAAVARRRKTGQRTARENIADLVDPGSFLEYGSLVLAARQSRNTIEELIDRTPADGLVAGVATVNGDLFPGERGRAAVMSYDYTVLAGTQGMKNHEKTDRLLDVVRRRRLPLLFFTEGGGGRPGDTDVITAGGLHTPTFHNLAGLSGLVPLVGINSGRCFAGNAAILGCCDVIIATENSNIGMGGPAMIEGGGLGVFKPEEVGPMSVQVPNGVVDIAVADEAEAVAVAKQYLSYFQGTVADWECADQRLLRHVVPENRRRTYEVRDAIDLMADTGSVLELRRAYGVGMITCLIRVEGRPLGVVANNPQHLGGAIDTPAADKAARFMQLCDAHDIPVMFLCDTPGNMVGPEAEKTGLVRHCCRLFLVGANMTVPFFTVVLRKGYGLGAQGMAGGGFHKPLFLVSWPTGEFGGMGLEGAVRLGFRDRLAAIADPEAREAEYQRLVDEMYGKGKALSAASLFEIDEVIDPADTRAWIMGSIDQVPEGPRRDGKKHAWIDAW